MDNPAFLCYLASGVRPPAVAQDAALSSPLAEHDRRFHPDGYAGGRCLYRARQSVGDDPALPFPAPSSRAHLYSSSAAGPVLAASAAPSSPSAEYSIVVARYTNPDGSKTPGWLRAPDGSPSLLDEHRWVLVRTPSFKRWFGDWETVAVGDAIHTMPPVVVTPRPPSLSPEKAYARLTEGENRLDGRRVRFVNSTLGKILRHKGYPTERIVHQLKDIFDNAIPAGFQEEQVREGHKKHPNFVGYHTYVGKIRDGEKDFFVRFTVQEEKTRSKSYNPNSMHSTFVSDVELYDAQSESDLAPEGEVAHGEARPLSRSTSSVGERENAPVVDNRLADFFAEVNEARKNCSKVVSPNGEPRMVYHGSGDGTLEELRDMGKGLWFSFGKEYADLYGESEPDRKTYECFLRLTNPLDVRGKVDSWVTVSSRPLQGAEASHEELFRIAEMLGCTVPEVLSRYDGKLVDDIVSSREFIERLKRRGYDGFIGAMQGDEIAMPVDAAQARIATPRPAPAQDSFPAPLRRVFLDYLAKGE